MRGFDDGLELELEGGDAVSAGLRGLRGGLGGDDGLFDLDGAGGHGSNRSHGLGSLLVGVGLRVDVERLRALGVVAVDGDSLEALTPALHVGLGDVIDGAVLREVDGLRDRSREERLRRAHHLDVAHVVDAARALGRLEGAVEYGEVLGLDGRRAFDGAGGVDVADDGVDLRLGVAELDERRGHGVVDDLDHAAADELLVLHEREIGLDAGGVAIHHEADGAGRSEDGDLGVAVAVTFAVRECAVPGIARGIDELVELRHNKGLGRVLRACRCC